MNKPTEQPSSITLNETGPFTLGSVVTFATVVGAKLKGYQYPMVYVEATRGVDPETGAPIIIYGQLDHPDASFTLGSGSTWSTEGAVPGVTVTAKLLVYPDIIPLCPPITFQAD